MRTKTPRVKKTPRERAEARARRFTYGLRISGIPLPDEALIRRAIEKSTAREELLDAAREGAARIERERFEGCLSVTAVAQNFSMKRSALFRLLDDLGWLCPHSGRLGTEQAIGAGYVVHRGPDRIRWVQLTPRGQEEIARRLGLNLKAQGDD